MSTAIQTTEEKPMSFVPYGSADAIKLSVSIIQNLIAVPTKSGKTCSKRDALKFMMMCQAKRLNPFEGDAYLLGYDTEKGPEFSLVTAHQSFLKRAELHPEFDGMASGIIVLVDAEAGKTEDREGDFHLPDAVIVGGWATVHCKNRKVPTHRRLRLARFNKGYAQWKVDPAGMIVKCAEADALRSTFPTMLGGLYLSDEVTLDVKASKVDTATDGNRLIEVITDAAPGQVEREPQAEIPASEQQEELKPEPAKNSVTPQVELMELVTKSGFTFTHLQKWGCESGNIPDADSMVKFNDVPVQIAIRLLRARKGLLDGLAKVKVGAA